MVHKLYNNLAATCERLGDMDKAYVYLDLSQEAQASVQ